MALLHTVRAGVDFATDAARPLARIWCDISHALDSDFAQLLNNDKLVWMPAHQAITAIQNKQMSNGRVLSSIDWRANRLVDGLAKEAAMKDRASYNTRRLISSAESLVRHEASLLGRITHVANNCEMWIQDDQDRWVRTVRRDAARPKTSCPSNQQRSATMQNATMQEHVTSDNASGGKASTATLRWVVHTQLGRGQ